MTTPVPYPRAMKKYPAIRQSLLSTFDDCSLQTKFEMDMRRGWSYSYQARGTLFHRFAAEALRTMVKQQEPQIPVEEALEILREVLAQHNVDRECPHCGGTRIRRGITKRGLRLCLTCRKSFETGWITVPSNHIADLYWVVVKWAHGTSYDVANVVDVERRLEARISYPNRVQGGWVERKLTGKLDALLVEGRDDEHAIVLDWKDMWKLPPEKEIDDKGYFQQRFYAYLIFENYPSVERVTLREFYVRYGKPREATITRAVIEEEVRAELSALVEKFDRAVEEHLWNASPGAHCSYCPAPHRCPIHPEARGHGRATTQAEAEQVAAEFVVASAIVKQTREAAGAWARQHGPIPIKDAKGKRVLGFKESTRTERPTVEEIDQLGRELGRAPTPKEIKELFHTRTSTLLTQYVPSREERTEQDDALIESLQRSIDEARSVA